MRGLVRLLLILVGIGLILALLFALQGGPGAPWVLYERLYVALAWPAANAVIYLHSYMHVGQVLAGGYQPHFMDWSAWSALPVEAHYRTLTDASETSRQIRAWMAIELAGAALIVGLAVLPLVWRRVRRRQPRPKRPAQQHAPSAQADAPGEWRVRRGDAPFVVGTVAGQVVGIPEREQYGHILIAGPPGTGKTTRLIVPNLLAERGTRNLLILDVTGELLQQTYAAVARRHRVLVLDITSPATSYGYNPLHYIRSYADALRLATLWIAQTGRSRDPDADSAAAFVLAASILHLHATVGPVSEPTLTHLQRFLLQGLTVVVPELAGSAAPAAKHALQSAQACAQRNPRLLEGVFSDLPRRFALLGDEAIQATTSCDELDLRSLADLSRAPLALYVTLNRRALADARPLLACVLIQVCDTLLLLADQNRDTPPRPLFGYLDDWGLVGAIAGLPDRLPAMTSARVGFALVVQDRAQLMAQYGQRDVQSIMTGCHTTIDATVAGDGGVRGQPGDGSGARSPQQLAETSVRTRSPRFLVRRDGRAPLLVTARPQSASPRSGRTGPERETPLRPPATAAFGAHSP